MSKSKPGETIGKNLQAREERLRQQLDAVETKKRENRDRITGKTKARSYVQKWLEALSTPELRHEAEIRGFLWDDFQTMEEAVSILTNAIFCGVLPHEGITRPVGAALYGFAPSQALEENKSAPRPFDSLTTGVS